MDDLSNFIGFVVLGFVGSLIHPLLVAAGVVSVIKLVSPCGLIEIQNADFKMRK